MRRWGIVGLASATRREGAVRSVHGCFACTDSVVTQTVPCISMGAGGLSAVARLERVHDGLRGHGCGPRVAWGTGSPLFTAFFANRESRPSSHLLGPRPLHVVSIADDPAHVWVAVEIA
jgi:hypothetical protein